MFRSAAGTVVRSPTKYVASRFHEDVVLGVDDVRRRLGQGVDQVAQARGQVPARPDRRRRHLAGHSKQVLPLVATPRSCGTPRSKVNAANPGYCATDLNGHNGFRTPDQGAEVSVHLATLPDDGPSGLLWGFQMDQGGGYGVGPW